MRIDHKGKGLTASVFFAILSLLSISPGNEVTAFADEVYLKNGDRITGQVVKMEDNKLVYKTAYGEITIDWQDIKTLSTEHPIRLVLSDERALEGTTESAEEGKAQVVTEDGELPVSLDLADVKTINPEKERPFEFEADVQVAIKLERGNTDTDNYHLDADFLAKYLKKNRLHLRAEFDQEKDTGVKTSNSALGVAQYSRLLTERWYAWGQGLWEFDEFKDLRLRSAYGAGPGYHIFDTPMTNLDVEAGVGWVFENYEDDTLDRDYPAAIWSLNFDQWLFKKFTQFFHTQLFYISLEDVSDNFWKTRTGLRFPLYMGFTTRLQWNMDWDDAPAPGRDPIDHTFLVSIGYSY